MGRKTGMWMIGAAAAVGVLTTSCQFESGKRVTWTSTIDTQFSITSGEDREIGHWHFDDPFEVNPGSVSLKLNYRANQAQGPLTASTLTWRLRVYDSTFSTMKFQYDLDTTGKMKQMGCCAYKVAFKGSDASFPGWNMAASDNLVWSVVPLGGTLPSGVALGIRYAYVAR